MLDEIMFEVFAALMITIGVIGFGALIVKMAITYGVAEVGFALCVFFGIWYGIYKLIKMIKSRSED